MESHPGTEVSPRLRQYLLRSVSTTFDVRPNRDRLSGLGHIMYAEELHASRQAQGRRGNGPTETRDCRSVSVDPADEAFARGAEHHGAAQTMENR